MPETIRTARDGAVARVVLNRPEARNAMNPAMIEELRGAFEKFGRDPEIRVVTISGDGPVFCAGGDLNWMRDVSGKTADEVAGESRRLLDMYRAIDACPKLVIASLHGAAFAGATGIVGCCDAVIAERGTRFCVSEVRLGLVPGIIAAVLLPRMGAHWFRYLAKTAVVFDAETAVRAGLVHEIADGRERLEARVAAHAALALEASPEAIAATGELVDALAAGDGSHARGLEANVEARFSEAAQEGIAAFLEKRAPAWRTGG